MHPVQTRSANAQQHPTALRPLALSLEVGAAMTIVATGAYALFLTVFFEPTTVLLYRAHVGSHLLSLVAVAAGILVVGVGVCRPALFGRSAYALSVAVAVISVALAITAVIHADSQLNPPLTAERAALAQF